MKIVCAVFDRAIQAFGSPWFVPASGHALRSFQTEVNRKAEDNPLFSHSEDFELWELASFDEDKGVFSGEKRLVARASDLKKE